MVLSHRYWFYESEIYTVVYFILLSFFYKVLTCYVDIYIKEQPMSRILA